VRVKEFAKRWYLILFLVVGLAIFGTGTIFLVSLNTPKTAIVTRVIDGDTIEIEGGQRIRYIGIDTPEKGEYFFEEATAKNSELVLGKEVRMEKDVSETDKYGRLLRYVYIGDLFVNAELVRLGYAKEAEYPPDTMHSDEFLRLERYAVASNLGLHNEPIPEPIKYELPETYKASYKATEVIAVVKASCPYFFQTEIYSNLTCSPKYVTFGDKWEVKISGYRAGHGYFSETWGFHEDTGEVTPSFEAILREFKGF